MDWTLWSYFRPFFSIYPSVPKTKIDTYENSVDSDETAHNEPFHLDLHRLQFSF